jgi:ribosomal protein S11
MAPKKNTVVKKKKYPKIASGLIKIRTTSNNTIINFSDNNGDTIMS